MKRPIALLLLAIFLFNVGGYMLLFQYYIYRADNILNEQISKNRYKPSELVEIKIPVQLPSIYDWSDYQSISGQVQLSHNSYNYVKLKITKDTLFLMCVPNYEKTRLIDANIIYARQISDLPLSRRSHAPVQKVSGPDYKYNCPIVLQLFIPQANTVQKTSIYFMPYSDDPAITINGQPPEAIG